MGKKDNSLKDFIIEAEEIIDVLNRSLLAMKSAPNHSGVRPDVINSIFRAAHTLKGMSGMVGLKKIAEVSHRMEDMLDHLRMGKLTLEPSVIDVLFNGVDTIRELVVSANAGRGEVAEIAPLLKAIDRTMKGNGNDTKERTESGLDPEILNVLTEYETHRLRENIRQGMNLIEIRVRFKMDNFDQDLARLTEKLQPSGEIISTLPSPGMSPDSGIEFNLIFGTTSEVEAIRRLLLGEVFEIKPLTGPAKRPSENGPSPEEIRKEGSIRSLTPTVRVDIGKLDALLNVVGELVLSKAVIGQIGRDMLQSRGFSNEGVELQKVYQALDRHVGNLQSGLIEIRMIPIGQIFDRLVQVVRKTSQDLGKEVDLQISGEETKLDKSMIEEIADPLMHLIRNSLDHGIETKEARLKAGKPELGIIQLRALQKGNNVVIEVEDDGGGIDLARVFQKGVEKGLLDKEKEYDKRELINLLFTPGFSTAKEVSEISGRGVGLDVVVKNISRLSGLVDVETEPGKGSKFSITLPITLVIIKALVVGVGTQTYAIPLNAVSESLMIEPKEVRTVERREVIQLRGRTLPLVRLAEVFGIPPQASSGERIYVIVVGLAQKRLGLVVDAIEGQQEIVIKSLGYYLRNIRGIAGATELGSRQTILVLDVGALIEEVTQTEGESGGATSESFKRVHKTAGK